MQSFISQGKIPYGIDIGTGTGLLAMMAASSGVNKITACEVIHSNSCHFALAIVCYSS